MAALADEPRGTDCEKLSSRELYRVRQGKYRILYEIRDADRTVVVVKVAHRSKAYDNT
jgi:mRNA interferase RelE/StbE